MCYKSSTFKVSKGGKESKYSNKLGKIVKTAAKGKTRASAQARTCAAARALGRG